MEDHILQYHDQYRKHLRSSLYKENTKKQTDKSANGFIEYVEDYSKREEFLRLNLF